MYEERKTGNTVKNIILSILIVLFLIFLLMWMFPLKGDLNNSLKPFYKQLFNDNMYAMKEAAKSYYTLERLPENVGDKVEMTLGEMLDLKLLLPFLDSNGKQCDNEKSYVEVTKMENEYQMKVHLKCTDYEDELLVHLGCYDYCKTFLCEAKAPETNTRPNINPVPDNKPDNKPDPSKPDDKPDPSKPDDPVYQCLYTKDTAGKETWSDWSNWSTKEVTANANREVQTKVETSTKTEKKLIGYNVKTYNDLSKPKYQDKTVTLGTKKEKYCAKTEYTWVETGKVKQEWVLVEPRLVSSHVLTSTDTVRYVPITTYDTSCKENCNSDMQFVYEKWELKSYPVKDKVEKCAEYAEREVPVTKTVKELVGYEQYQVREPVYKDVTVEVKTTYYRFRTKTTLAGEHKEKWSIKGDNSLLNDGYLMQQCVLQ